jgi:hypothetical protein
MVEQYLMFVYENNNCWGLVKVCHSGYYIIQGSSWWLIIVCGIFNLNIDLETRYASIVTCGGKDSYSVGLERFCQVCLRK